MPSQHGIRRSIEQSGPERRQRHGLLTIGGDPHPLDPVGRPTLVPPSRPRARRRSGQDADHRCSSHSSTPARARPASARARAPRALGPLAHAASSTITAPRRRSGTRTAGKVLDDQPKRSVPLIAPHKSRHSTKALWRGTFVCASWAVQSIASRALEGRLARRPARRSATTSRRGAPSARCWSRSGPGGHRRAGARRSASRASTSALGRRDDAPARPPRPPSGSALRSPGRRGSCLPSS